MSAELRPETTPRQTDQLGVWAAPADASLTRDSAFALAIARAMGVVV
ncbi:MAG: hypothetical protein QOI20_1000, partial [Acidimicrobiaceae bacterium]|nr:hypothetical protein [Acidimicrobiaceae bacterium]